MNAGRQPAIAVLGNDRHAFAAVGIRGINGNAAVVAPAIHDELGAVGEGVFNRVVVEVLVHVIAAIMAAAQRLGLDRPGVLHPAEMIDVVDVKVAVAPAAGPEEAVEVLNLPEQFTRFARPFFRERRSDRSVHSIAAQQYEVADFAVLDALMQFLERPAVAGHQSHAYFQVLRCRLLGEREHPAGGRTIRRQRLFHEDVEPLLNGVSKMHPTKRQWRRKDRNVAGLQTVHRLPVCVEANELAVCGHIHLAGAVSAQSVITGLEAVIEDVGHGDELDRDAFYIQSICRCASTTAAAADQGDLDAVVSGGVNARNRHAGQGRCRGNPAGIFDEFAT